MASTKTTPRDALVMASILKDMGIIEYEPRVINQMLEFTYRYITNILDDARVFSSHAKKKSLDVDDVKLAIQMQMDKSFTTPPPRDILIDISRQRNSTPLPLIKPHCGLRLPPDRYCLSACNYHVKATKKVTIIVKLRFEIGRLRPASFNLIISAKVTPAINLTSKSGASLSLVNKANAPPTVTIVTRPSGTGTTTTIGSSSISSSTPTPIIKFSSGGSSVSTPQSGSQDTINTTSNEGSSSSNKIPILVTRTVVASSDSSATNTDASGKRKREIDDDYDVE